NRLGSRAMIDSDSLLPFFRIEPRGNFSRTDQITEQHGQIAPLAAPRLRTIFRLLDRLDTLFRRRTRRRHGSQCSSAFTAKSRTRCVIKAATCASGFERNPALIAEFQPIRIIVSAIGTGHHFLIRAPWASANYIVA